MVELQQPWWGVKIVPGPAPTTGRPDTIYYEITLSRTRDPTTEWFASNRTAAKKLAALEAHANRKTTTLAGTSIGYVTVRFDHGTKYIGYQYFPLGNEPGYWFRKLRGKGLAQLIELQVQNDLRKRGFGDYQVGHYGTASPSYTTRLQRQERDRQTATLKVDREKLRHRVAKGMRKANLREARKRKLKKVLGVVASVFMKRRRSIG